VAVSALASCFFWTVASSLELMAHLFNEDIFSVVLELRKYSLKIALLFPSILLISLILHYFQNVKQLIVYLFGLLSLLPEQTMATMVLLFMIDHNFFAENACAF
jgi:hypothetical protein